VREGLTRLFWLLLVLAAFCLPLFVGLGQTDVENDEGIYSYAVDKILERGDWLNPRSSPHENAVFLEKPPLKFWLVAAPIHFGLLPHTEVGLRVWDALFGAIAFLYVFAIGRRLSGPICGVTAVMVLFVYSPLLLSHGLRGNNMEAPLFLAYCGGVYHWLAWAREPAAGRRRLHVLLVALYFFLGFMTKFVAVAFLPMVLGLATLVYREPRQKLIQDWRHWALAFTLFVVCAAPWFIYQQLTVGNYLWRVILGEHVYTRFTASVDPTHVQPWTYYFVAVFTEFQRIGTYWLVLTGVALIIFRTVTTRWLEGFVVIAWFVVPISLMSFGTSKLQHYAYPFLPPLALAAGYGIAWLIGVLVPRLERPLEAVNDKTSRFRPPPAVSTVLLGLAGIAIIVWLATLIFGPIRWRVSGVTLFRNTDTLRPLIVAAVLMILSGRAALAGRVVALALIVVLIPIQAYRRMWTLVAEPQHPLRSARECVKIVRQREVRSGHELQPLYAVAPEKWFIHSYFYYLRHFGWQRVERVDDGGLYAALAETPRPVLITDEDYKAFKQREHFNDSSLSMVRLQHAVLLLPGPYAVCGDQLSRVSNAQ
jgi:hypothetical protein